MYMYSISFGGQIKSKCNQQVRKEGYGQVINRKENEEGKAMVLSMSNQQVKQVCNELNDR